MSRIMSPSLLALALGLLTGGSLFAASTSERDQQALAAKQLIQAGLRLPAQHQVDEFKAGGYSDDGQWIEKVLREAFLLRFLTEIPPPASAAPGGATVPPPPSATGANGDQAKASTVDPKLERELKGLTAELDAAVKGNALPVFAKTLRGGSGNSVERLVNELGHFINPSMPKPVVPPGPEKRQGASSLAEVLAKTMDEEFKKALEKIKAHKADEERMWNLDDKTPEYKKIITEACDLRIEALSGAYLALIGLREVSYRGKDFGIEPAQTAAQAFLKTFIGEHRETISQWDFEWGEFTPFIRAYANVLLSVGVRLGVKDCKEDEVESGLQSVIDFDTRPILRNPTEVIEAYKLKLSMWANMLRWRLEMGTARSYNKGLSSWNDFLERQKTEPNLRLGGPPRLAVELGQLYILASRLHRAKDDGSAASALLGQLIAQRPGNPLAGNAKAWLADGGDHGGSWPSAPLANEPGTAINVARAFISESNATAEPARQRSNLLQAAVTLRNAVLALGSVTDQVLIDSGPASYDLYASTLNRLGMLQHAAVVGVEGARVFANYLDALEKAKKPNPWYKPGTTVWRLDVVTPRQQCMNAGIYAERLSKLDKSMQRLADDATEQLTRISPTDVGWQQKYQQILAAIEDGDFAAALEKAHKFIVDFPAHDLLGIQVMISIRQRWCDKLTNPTNSNAAKIKEIQDEGAKDNAATLAMLDKEQNKTPPPDAERMKAINSTRSAVQSALIESMLAAKKYVEIMDLVVPVMLNAPPSDERLAARELKLLCHAASEYNKEASAGDKGKDIAALQANWKRYSDIYRCVVKMLPKLRNHGVDSDLRPGSLYLANLFNAVSNQILTLARAGGASAAVTGLSEEANRAFADLFEPWIDDKTPPPNILFCANKLWEVDQKERAAHLYERYQVTLANDSELQTFLKDPRPLLDKYGEPILVRTEFKKAWDEILDLSYDTPEFIRAYDLDLPPDKMPPGVHADYFKALTAITVFRAKALAAQKVVMAPEQYKAIEASLTGLERLLTALANNLVVMKHLAQYYRESGQFEKAIAILKEIYKFDSHDPDAAIAIIDVVRREMLGGRGKVDEMRNARDIAAKVREIYRNSNKLGYWEAEILVMEFSLGLGESKAVNDTLAFMNRNRSDLSRDLIAPRIEGDDKRARRAMNAQAGELAKRFLELYGKTGISQKAAYRVDAVEAGGKTIFIYTDLDAPKFTLRTIKTKDDDEVLVLLPEDAQVPEPSTAPPAGAAPPTTPPAAAAPPAASAPAPAAPAKTK